MDNLLPRFKSIEQVKKERETQVREQDARNQWLKNEARRGKKCVSTLIQFQPALEGQKRQAKRKINVDELRAADDGWSPAKLKNHQILQASQSCLLDSFSETKRTDAESPENQSQVVPFTHDSLDVRERDKKLDSSKHVSMQAINCAAQSRSSEVTVFQTSRSNACRGWQIKTISSSERLLVPDPSLSLRPVITIGCNPRQASSAGEESKEWSPVIGHRMCSISDRLPILIEFRNQTSKPAQIFWIDYDGKLVLRLILGPSSSYVEKSYTSHPWLVIVGTTRTQHSKNELLLLVNRLERPIESIIWNSELQTISSMERHSTSAQSPNLVLMLTCKK